VLIGGLSSAVSVAQSIERVDLNGFVADFTYQAVGNQVNILRAGSVIATVTPKEGDGTKVRFADGSAVLKVTALGTASLGSAAIGTTAAAITVAAVASLDSANKSESVNLGGTTVTPPTTPQAFTLTTSFDTITGTAGNDVFNASGNGLLTTSDTVTGGAGTDTINSRHTVTDPLTINATISGVEVHNVRIDHDGAANDTFTYSMADVSGATKVVMDRSVNSGSTADAVFTISGSGFTTAVITGISGGDTGADNSAVDLTATYASTTGGADSATVPEDDSGKKSLFDKVHTVGDSARPVTSSSFATGVGKTSSSEPDECPFSASESVHSLRSFCLRERFCPAEGSANASTGATVDATWTLAEDLPFRMSSPHSLHKQRRRSSTGSVLSKLIGLNAAVYNP
jgi:hypothetical protein